MSKPSSPSSPSTLRRRRRHCHAPQHAVVMVLGDVGRSPRMQYHAWSLLEAGCYVTLVGYHGEGLIPPLEDAAAAAEADSTTATAVGNGSGSFAPSPHRGNLRVVRLKPFAPPRRGPLKVLYYPLRLVGLVLCIVRGLWFEAGRSWPTPTTTTHRINSSASFESDTAPDATDDDGGDEVPPRAVPLPNVLLVQNPPSVPTLFLAYLYCVWRGVRDGGRRPRLVIDWHNLGFTMFDDDCVDDGDDIGANGEGERGSGRSGTKNKKKERRRKPSTRLIRALARCYERIFAPKADAHLCVTGAMRVWLMGNFRIGLRESVGGGGGVGEKGGRNSGVDSNLVVLRDGPPQFFKPTSVREEHELMMRLTLERGVKNLEKLMAGGASSEDGGMEDDGSKITERTLFTEAVARPKDDKSSSSSKPAATAVKLRRDRPALVVSSTSWTPDEDFSVLFDALVILDALASAKRHNGINKSDVGGVSVSADGNYGGVSFGISDGADANDRFPHVVVVVTGKGPQKAYYERIIEQFNYASRHVTVLTAWLEAKDYPTLLGCADLGVSLHTSTSGLDLPMKILDMYGCGVPVCAVGFPCLGELVQDGTNGRVFYTAEELAGQIYELLGEKKSADEKEGGEGREEAQKPSRLGGAKLARYREAIRHTRRWKENWDEYARDLILRNDDEEDGNEGRKKIGGNATTFMAFVASMIIVFLSIKCNRFI